MTSHPGWLVYYDGKYTTHFILHHAATAEEAADYMMKNIVTLDAADTDNIYVFPAAHAYKFKVKRSDPKIERAKVVS